MKNISYLVIIILFTSNFSSYMFSQSSPNIFSSFGEIDEKIKVSNINTESKKRDLINTLELKAKESPSEYGENLKKGKQINEITEIFNLYLENLKSEMENSVEDPTDYESMDKSEFLDNAFFKDDKITPRGQEFLNNINNYRDNLRKILSDVKGMESIVKEIYEIFCTKDAIDREGNPFPWLEYHYKGFPLIASLTKITVVQSDAKNIEIEILSKLIEKPLTNN
ncbi:hypothetical protein [Mariniflexile sp. HMF6888]|uniref:hypothetical protein n=1 Tax=Mariniflexile sp. HMF6888 TaxID=3373086 RepID=UPI00379726BE